MLRHGPLTVLPVLHLPLLLRHPVRGKVGVPAHIGVTGERLLLPALVLPELVAAPVAPCAMQFTLVLLLDEQALDLAQALLRLRDLHVLEVQPPSCGLDMALRLLYLLLLLPIGFLAPVQVTDARAQVDSRPLRLLVRRLEPALRRRLVRLRVGDLGERDLQLVVRRVGLRLRLRVRVAGAHLLLAQLVEPPLRGLDGLFVAEVGVEVLRTVVEAVEHGGIHLPEALELAGRDHPVIVRVRLLEQITHCRGAEPDIECAEDDDPRLQLDMP